MFSPHGTLGLFSRELAAPQKDWPANTRITGFPFCGQIDGGPLEADLEKFLPAGPAPAVFTLGSNVVREAGSFYQESLEAAKSAGCRAVLLTGEDARNRVSGASCDLTFSCAYAPYKMLFPPAAAVVHRGGIGTFGHAMAAGVMKRFSGGGHYLHMPAGRAEPANALAHIDSDCRELRSDRRRRSNQWENELFSARTEPGTNQGRTLMSTNYTKASPLRPNRFPTTTTASVPMDCLFRN
jgi:hypothetical protein